MKTKQMQDALSAGGDIWTYSFDHACVARN